jgi:dihydrodipicolinate reductase
MKSGRLGWHGRLVPVLVVGEKGRVGQAIAVMAVEERAVVEALNRRTVKNWSHCLFSVGKVTERASERKG